MSSETNQFIQEILLLCLKITSTGNDAFFEYIAHVQILAVDVYKGRWSATKDSVFKQRIYLNTDSIDTLNEVILQLKEILGIKV